MPENIHDPVVYRSHVRIERLKGPIRRAFVPASDEPVMFGVHSEVAQHYGVDNDVYEAYTTTLDYVIAAAAGWMTGTFGGALEARGIPADSGKLYSESVGELEKDRGVLVIKRIHVSYVLNVTSELISEKKDAIQRAFNLHPESCPVYKSIHKSINITKELEIVEANGN